MLSSLNLVSFRPRNKQISQNTPISPLFVIPLPKHSTCLVLGAALGELEHDSTAGQPAVDLAVGIETVVNTTLLLLVQDNLEGLGAVLLGANALADDLNGVDQVSEDVVVDGGQGAGTGTLLGLVGAGVDGALGAGQNAALSNEEDVAVRELLLQLTGQAVERIVYVSPTACLGSAGESEMLDARSRRGLSYRCWILWKFCRRGTGTKTTMAFLPWPTST